MFVSSDISPCMYTYGSEEVTSPIRRLFACWRWIEKTRCLPSCIDMNAFLISRAREKARHRCHITRPAELRMARSSQCFTDLLHRQAHWMVRAALWRASSNNLLQGISKISQAHTNTRWQQAHTYTRYTHRLSSRVITTYRLSFLSSEASCSFLRAIFLRQEHWMAVAAFSLICLYVCM